MAGSISPYRHPLTINRIAMMWFYPRLRELPPEAWESMLSKARDTDLDTAEWVGVIGGVGFVAWLLGIEPFPLATQPPFIGYLLQFVFALPLLAAVVGPIYLRRTRRGLDRELARRETCTGNAKALSGRKEA
jgi:hypothetical protein